MTNEPNGRRLDPWRIAGYLMNLIAVSALALTGYNLREVTNNDKRLTAIESNRFTSAHGLEIWKAIAELKLQIAMVPNSLPPPWFVHRVDKLETRMEKLEGNQLQMMKSQSEIKTSIERKRP